MHVNSLSAVLVVNLELVFLMHVPAPTKAHQRRCQSPALWAGPWGSPGQTCSQRRHPFPPGRQGRTPGWETGSRCTRLWSAPAENREIFERSWYFFILNPIKDCSNSLFTHSQLSSRFRVWEMKPTAAVPLMSTWGYLQIWVSSCKLP